MRIKKVLNHPQAQMRRKEEMGKREWKGGRDGVERRKTELPIGLEKMKMICQQQT